MKVYGAPFASPKHLKATRGDDGVIQLCYVGVTTQFNCACTIKRLRKVRYDETNKQYYCLSCLFIWGEGTDE